MIGGSRPVGSGIGLLETVCRFEAFYLHPPNPLLLKSQVGLMFLFLLFVDLDMSHMSLLESSGWFETTNQPRCPSHSVERHF